MELEDWGPWLWCIKKWEGKNRQSRKDKQAFTIVKFVLDLG